MCTPIYNVYNITLWSCPIKTVCPQTQHHTNTHTLENQTNHTNTHENRTNYTDRHAFENRTNHTNAINIANSSTIDILNQTSYENVSIHNNTNHTVYNRSHLRYICTQLFLENAPKYISSPSPSSSREIRMLAPSPRHYLRAEPLYNHSNHTNSSGSLGEVQPGENLEWLHVLWALPVILGIIYMYKYRQKMRLRIVGMFIPKERYIQRSRSWPELAQANSPIDTRSRSEPNFDTVVF